MQTKTLTDEALEELLYEYMPKVNILLDQLEEERDKDIPRALKNIKCFLVL